MTSVICFVFIRLGIQNLDLQAALHACILSPTEYNKVIFLWTCHIIRFYSKTVAASTVYYIFSWLHPCIFSEPLVSGFGYCTSAQTVSTLWRKQEPGVLLHPLIREGGKCSVTLDANAKIIVCFVASDSVTKFHKIPYWLYNTDLGKQHQPLSVMFLVHNKL